MGTTRMDDLAADTKEHESAMDERSPAMSLASADDGRMPQTSRPIFIVGTLFSGISLLGWALAQHPVLKHVSDTTWLHRISGELEAIHDVMADHGHQARLVTSTVPRSRLYETFGDAINRLFVVSGAELLPPGVTQPRRWVDTTLGHSSHVVGLRRLFPRASFVHVVRDVHETVKSLVLHAEPHGYSFTEDAAYEYWLRVTRECLEAELAFGSTAMLRIRYVDLVNEPEGALRRCFDFVGETYTEDALRPIRAVQPDLDTATRATEYEIRTHAAVRHEAALLSRLLIRDEKPRYDVDPDAIEHLEQAFSERLRGSTPLGIEWTLVDKIRRAVRTTAPAGSKIVVISKGDDALLDLDGCEGWHFPQAEDGSYAGYYPADSYEAIFHLRTMCEKGAEFLLVPRPSMWWLQHYAEFTQWLRDNAVLVYYQEHTCALFSLSDSSTQTSPATRVVFESTAPVGTDR